ncbi:hypothetical protein A4A49_10960 [Nicotiana attenuata]|uniref:Uncharacterized protein n=1 Tax=Nicotiana attenuata TaxID=49451 RepID=A0A1J6ISY2_NICAT|nr:hypothetical protein A4A49_10960 [Nicotiana attenuata]
MSDPSFLLFSDSQSVFSRNPSSSHVENTTETVELEGGKGKNINASSVDGTLYQSLPDTNSEPIIGGVPVNDKGKGKVVEDSELGGSRRESVPKTETQPVDVDRSDDSQLKKKKIGVAPKKIWVMHHLLIREVHHEVKNEMRFIVSNSRLRFGLGEFALVTGLKFSLIAFQVFGTQLPKRQSMHESTGGDSEPTNAEVMKELQGLKLFVETKFEEVLAAISRQPMKPEGNSAHKQQDNDPYFREMHNDYDQFERGHVGNDPVVIGDSTPKAPSMSSFGGVGRDGGASGVNVKNVTARHGVVNDDLRSGIPAQTRADAVIESNTAPQVDGVGQVDVGGSNVNLSSAPCRHRGDLHLDSDFEYTDSQLDLIVAITQGGRRNVNQSGNELTTRDVNNSKPDQSLSRTIVQTQIDVETTPAVFTRRRRPAAVKQSPYRNDWKSGVSAVGGSSKVIKGRFPFVNDISVAVDYKLTTAFSNFVEVNMQLGECVFVSIDYGVYVACFAEYIIEDLPILVANFDVDGLRARFGILLWHHGRNKQLHGESSEFEAPVAPKKTRGRNARSSIGLFLVLVNRSMKTLQDFNSFW